MGYPRIVVRDIRVRKAGPPARIVAHPNAAAPTIPAAMIDRRRVRFLMRLPLLGGCAHLEREIDLTHRLVDSAWLRRSFEAVREQVGLKGKRAGGKGLQRRNVGHL